MDAQKTQSYLPAALHLVKQEATLSSPLHSLGRSEPWSNAVMCVCACVLVRVIWVVFFFLSSF